MTRHTRTPAFWNTLLVLSSLAAGMVLGLAPSAHSVDGYNNGNSRGDNPVVGSLPCMVNDPRMYWTMYPFLNPQGGYNLASVPATLTFMGAPELGGAVLTAEGDPYGGVNASTGWTYFSISTNCNVSFNRSAIASGSVGAWQWVPQGYVGGRVVYQGPNDSTTLPILAQFFPVPIQSVAWANTSATMTITIHPNLLNAALGVRVIKVANSGGVLRVQYQF